MKTENFLLFLAAIAVVISAIGAAVTYNSVSNGKEIFITGFVTDTATVNLTVLSSADINFTTDNINFGSGRVSSGSANATLITTGKNNSGGNWSNVTTGFILENIGNVNVTLDLMSGKSAASFIGGTNPQYQYNLTNYEANSCHMNQSIVNFSFIWYDFNTTSPGTRICTNFSYVDTNDVIRIDLKLNVPSDSLTGALGDIVTATASQST